MLDHRLCTFSSPLYNGAAVVQRSVEIGEPIIYVAINYRYGPGTCMLVMWWLIIDLFSLNVFGFLGGQEIREAGLGNLGLHDRTYHSPSAYMRQN